MTKRVQRVDRIQIPYEDKALILYKSNHRCSRCGCILKMFDPNYTLDHVIPINKGGTNEIQNLVPLCAECNEKKSNSIIHPQNYYRYLTDDYMAQVSELYKNYIEDVSWFSKHNFTKEDILTLYYEQPTTLFSSNHKKSRKGESYGTVLNQTAVLKKASYQDTDKIADFVRKYDNKFGLDASTAKEAVDEIFYLGAIYTLQHGDEIIAVFPLSISKIVLSEEEQYSVFNFNGIPCLYQRDYYKSLIFDAFYYILECCSYVNEYAMCSFTVDLPKNDTYTQSIISEFNAKPYASYEQWVRYLGMGAFKSSKISEESVKELFKKDSSRAYQIVSDGIERQIERIPDKIISTSSKKQTKNKVIAKQQKRDANIIDEYDVRYYI